jgi:hypothetical protein
MGCKNCKEKKEIISESSKSKSSIDRLAGWVIIIWFLLGCYGLYSLIIKIFS